MTPAEFSLHYHRLVFDNRCHERKGLEFQHFFESIMVKHNRSFTPVKPHGREGDWKNDGWISGSGTLFQVYAPETTVAKDIIAKVKDDFEGALTKWSKHLQAWTFVYSEQNALPSPVLAVIEDLQKAHPQITFDTWNREALWQIVAQMPLEVRNQLLGSLPLLSEIPAATASEIQALLKFVAKQDTVPGDAGTKLLDLRPKLELNRLGQSIRSLVGPGLTVAPIVADYLARHPDPDFNSTVSQSLASHYDQLVTEYADRPEQVFFSLILWVQSGMPDQSQHPRYFWAATGIVSHYFELCDIFESHTA